MANIFNKLTFKKLNTGKTAASKSGMVFKKLTTVVEPPSPPMIIPGLYPDNFNLGWIGLKPGTYILTATIAAPSLGLAESEHSDYIEYKVK